MSLMSIEEMVYHRNDSCEAFDLRTVINNLKIDYSSLFYSTDHHWTSETGLWACGVIVDEINNRFCVELDNSNLSAENYTYTIYENYMLGSQGKRTGIVYAGLDDFTLIEPLYETDYVLEIPSLDIKKSGSYSETMLFKEYLEKDLYNGDPGRVYTGDNYSVMTIQNMLASNDTKVLLIKDSFSKSVIPFLSSTCSELHVIDLRTFEDSVLDYVSEKDIDIVIVLYNPSVVVNEKFFEFL